MERIIQDKRGLEFKSSFFAIVAVSLLVVAFGIIIDTQANFYSTDAVSEVGGYNRLSEISEETSGYRGDLTPEDTESGDNAESSTFRGVYGIITGFFGAFDIVNDMVNGLADQFGIDDVWIQGFFVILSIAIATSLIAIIFRLARRTA